jgi:hypothetical protein
MEYHHKVAASGRGLHGAWHHLGRAWIQSSTVECWSHACTAPGSMWSAGRTCTAPGSMHSSITYECMRPCSMLYKMAAGRGSCHASCTCVLGIMHSQAGSCALQRAFNTRCICPPLHASALLCGAQVASSSTCDSCCRALAQCAGDCKTWQDMAAQHNHVLAYALAGDLACKHTHTQYQCACSVHRVESLHALRCSMQCIRTGTDICAWHVPPPRPPPVEKFSTKCSSTSNAPSIEVMLVLGQVRHSYRQQAAAPS